VSITCEFTHNWFRIVAIEYLKPVNLPTTGVVLCAVRALTESLRRELRAERLPIRISCISPGVVASEFSANYNGIPAGERETHSKEVYGKHKVLQPEDIADAVCYILGAPPHIDVNDILMRSSEDPNI